MGRPSEVGKKNADFYLKFLLVVITAGTGLSVAGGTLWYRRIQCPEDMKRELEIKKLAGEIPQEDEKEIILTDG